MTPLLDYRPSTKTEAGLKATIRHSLEGGKPILLTRQYPSDVINTLRAMDIDCELEGDVIRGTIDGKPWSFTVVNS